LSAGGAHVHLADLLAGLDVYLIGMHCDVDEIDRRERARADGGSASAEPTSPWTAHTFGPYDLDVDTTTAITSDLVTSILGAWNRRTSDWALPR
jgi:chloramphenicol 3-O phosphotransferase